MAKYRKKPVVIEAFQYTGRLNLITYPLWFTERLTETDVWFIGEVVQIDTLEGIMTAQNGDYIIKGIQGEIYPCKPEIFEASYEIVKTTTTERM